LFFLFTAPYAASRQQPIFSGCCLEWRLADNRQKVTMKQAALFAYFTAPYALPGASFPSPQPSPTGEGVFLLSSE
jgi:hypothetical protein